MNTERLLHHVNWLLDILDHENNDHLRAQVHKELSRIVKTEDVPPEVVDRIRQDGRIKL